MIYLTGLDLTNVVTFKKLSVDFDQNLTYVRGLNLDSDPASPTSNGAGKTLMFSAIANLLYQTTPLALKKKSKKDLLRQRGSSVGLILTADGGPEHEIIQTSTGYKIYADGKDLELRTIPLAEEYISKLFPLSETKFYSTCYLSTQRPYPLQRDTDSNRLQHISDIFNLDMYSGIKDILTVRLRSIKDNELKLSVLEQQLLGIRKKISELKDVASLSEYEAAKREYNKSTKRIDLLKAQKFELATRERDLSALLAIEQQLDLLRKDYASKKKPASLIVELKASRTACQAWDRWSQRSAQSKATLDKIEKKLNALDLPELPAKEQIAQKKELEARSIKLTDSIDKILVVKKLYDAYALTHKELTEELDALGVDASKVDLSVDYDSEIAVLKSTLKLQRLLDHDHGDLNECPTCLSELDIKAIASTVASAKKKLPKLELYSSAAHILTKLNKLEAQEAPDTKRLKALKSKLAKCNADVDECSRQLELHKSIDALLEQKADVDIPDVPDVDRPSSTVDELDASIELCSSIIDALSSKAILLSNHPDLKELRSADSVVDELNRIKSQSDELDSTLRQHQDKLSTFAETVSQYEQQQNVEQVYLSEQSQLESKIAKLSESMSDKKILEVLVKAYGTKGLRATAADSVCGLLQTNLNHYRDLIFAEPFTFEVNASETGVSILVDRNNGKPDSVSDVRNLSGAESNSFQLLCLISILPLMPDTDRVNLVILDEPTSHMCPISRTIFNERYLPVLREVVPSTYVISPNSDDLCSDSVEWTVQKRNGVSSIII